MAELLAERGLSQRELAVRTGRPPKTINEIIRGKAEITPDTAIQLERALGVSARFWLAREDEYRRSLAARREERQLLAEVDWLRQFPIREMADRGWIPACDSKVEKMRAALNFFGVASPTEWRSVWLEPQAQFRKSQAFRSNAGALAAWLRRGELEASRAKCAPFDRQRFMSVLRSLRRVTAEPPETFDPQLRTMCAECGVAVVFVGEIRGSSVSGATRWLSPTKALMQLSLRYKTDDHLWFTFFHEAGHVLLHGKRSVFIEKDGRATGAEEEEANQFAADLLIPRLEYKRLLASAPFTESALRRFARDSGIAPGIVVGRLQHDGQLPHSHLNGLKRRLRLVERNAA